MRRDAYDYVVAALLFLAVLVVSATAWHGCDKVQATENGCIQRGGTYMDGKCFYLKECGR